MKNFLIFLAVYIICHFFSVVYPNSAAAELENVTIQLKRLHQFQFAGYYAAKEKGFYADEGLDVALAQRNPQKSHIQSVLDGDAQYGIADSVLLIERMRGKPVVLLKQIFQHSPLVIITLQKTGIATSYDLRGKRLMIDRKGHSDAPLIAMLNNTLGDLNQVEFHVQSLGLDALIEGEVDGLSAYITNQPYMLKQQGQSFNIIDPRDYGIDFYGDNLFTTEAEIRRHPERVKKLIRASLKGWRYAIEHPQEIIDLIRSKYNTQLDRAKLEYEAQIIAGMIQVEKIPLGTVIPARLDEIARTYKQAGMISARAGWQGFLFESDTASSVAVPAREIDLSDAEKKWLQAHPRIRIGIDPAYAPYSFRDHEGRYRGIAMEFRDYLSEQLGITMQVVPDLSWPEIVTSVRQRSLDVVVTMSHRPEREAFVNFTKIYLPTPLVIMQRSGEAQIRSEADLAGHIVAMVEGYSSSERVMEEHPNAKPHMVKTALEGLFAVATGKADAYVGVLGINFYLAQENGITNLEVASLYGTGTNGQRFGVRKDWPELAAILDKALAAIPEADQRRLFERWLPAQAAKPPPPRQTKHLKKIALTSEERAWLIKHPRIEVGVMNAWPPFDFVDQKGRPRGIGVDIIEALNKRLDSILIATPGDWPQIYGAVKEKQLAALLDITPKESRESHFNFTRPYLSVPHVIIARKETPHLRFEDDLIGKTLALEKGFGNVGYFTTNYPAVSIKEYSNTATALDAVARDEADAYAGNRAVATYLIEKEVLLNLKVHGRLKKKGSILAIGTRKDWPILRDILQKALDDISWTERREILKSWVDEDQRAEFGLTEKEKAWLIAHLEIRVGVNQSWPPMDYLDEHGKPQGIGVAFIRALNLRLNNVLKIVPGSWDKIYAGVQEKRLDALTGITPRPDREAFFNFTQPYVTVPHVIIARKGESLGTGLKSLDGRTLGVERGFFIVNVVKQHYPGISVKEYETTSDALHAVANGEADAYVGNRAVAVYLIEQELIANLQIYDKIKETVSINAIGVRKDWPILNDILKKALESLSVKEKREILGNWVEVAAPVIQLTPLEEAWLAAHPSIRVSSEPDYAPFDFQQNGKPAGYSIDYVKLLAGQLGIRLEFVQDNWSNLLEKAKRREVDLVHTIFNTPKERETYLNFTKPYKQTLNAIITHRDVTDIRSLDDLASRTVALVTGDSAGIVLRQQFPSMGVVAADNYEAALKAVAFGRAEATITELPVANYQIRNLLLSNLMVAAEVGQIGERDQQYRLAVRKDWPEFIPILEKAIDSITPEELAVIDNRWMTLPAQGPDVVSQRPTSLLSGAAFQIGLIALLFAVMAWLLLRQLGRSQSDPLSTTFATGGARRFILLLNALLVAFVITLAWWALDRIKLKIQDDMRESLETVLHTTMEALNIWVKDQKSNLDNITHDPRIIVLASRQLAHLNQGTDLLFSSELADLRGIFAEFQHSGHMGFFVIAPDGMNIASMQETDIGVINIIQQQRPDLLRRAFDGETVLIPPIPSDGPLKIDVNIATSSRPPSMFFAAPIRDGNGEVIAVLTEQLDPHGDFSRISQLGRIGKTGETYTFDRQGRLLSESRFLHQLISARLIQPGGQSILSIEIRDPGAKLLKGSVPRSEQPLTRMAASAIQGKAGYDVEGYRNYRGVPVIGAWAWDASLGIGITSEIDLAEALGSYNTARNVTIVILVLTVLLTLAFSVLILVIGERANLSLKASRDQLEERVEQRTHELKKLTRAVEQSPVSVVITDKEGAIEYVNPTFATVTGYSYEEAIGQNPRILKSDKHTPEFYEDLWKTILSGETWTGDLVNKKKSGEEFWERAAIAPLVDEFGTITHFVAVKEDVSQRKRMEQDLVEAKEASEAANRAKSVFLANMSHEIRTPMNAILGYSQIMQHDETLSREQQKSLEIINRSGDHLLALINDVLEMSKIEAGRIELNPIPFDLHALINDLDLMFRVRTNEKSLSFSVEKDENLPRFVNGDENKIRQVLTNLLGNAVKFTLAGEIRFKASWRDGRNMQGQYGNDAELEAHNFDLNFDVIDTGPGVPQLMLESIFDAFEQTESGRRTEGGTGLGLAISRQYARMMGGDITVQSQPDRGSVFRFTVGTTETKAIATKTQMAAQCRIVGMKEEHLPQRILVVDDRHYNVDILTKMLIRVGFEVHPAFNGKEAVDLFKNWHPQAVLIDIRMPVMDGIEATKRIRTIENEYHLQNPESKAKDTVIIAVSASALEYQRKTILQDGLVNDFVSKPFKETEIFNTIQKHLGVEYIYQEGESEKVAKQAKLRPGITADASVNLPEFLTAQLREATINLDVDQLRDLIEQIKSHDEVLAARMGELVDRFDFESIGKLVGDTG